MKNHIGKYECKLCLTLHNNEGSYLTHTQGKRHQDNLCGARGVLFEATDFLAFLFLQPAARSARRREEPHAAGTGWWDF